MSKQSFSKSTGPGFLLKLAAILEDKQYEQTISWNETCNGFKIINLHEFIEKVLPKYFKHQNFSSFIRQLNMYGFVKLKSQQFQHIYQNNNFIRGNRSSIIKIQRRGAKAQTKQEKKKAIQKQKSEEAKSIEEIIKIKEKQSILEQKLKQMLENNKRLFNQNLTIVSNVRKEDKKQDKVFADFFKIFRISSHKKSLKKQKSMTDEHQSQLSTDKSSLFQTQQNKIKGEIIQSSQSPLSNQNNQNFLQLNEFQEFQNIEKEDQR